MVLGFSAMLPGLPLSRLAFAAGAAAPAAAKVETKDHVLFLGLDLFVQEPEGTIRVQRVSRDGIELDDDGTIHSVPLRQRRDFQVILEPKVSDFSVTLDRFTEVRAISPGRDNRMQEAMQQQMLVDDLRSQQIDRVSQASVAHSAAESALNAPVDAADPRGAQAIREGRQQAHDAAVTELRAAESSLHMLGGMNPIMNATDDPYAPHDAVDISFRISSPVVLENAHAVVVTVFRLPSTPRTTAHGVMVEPLPRITSKPRTVRIQHAALPLGFELVGSRVHIYADGREVATNLSPRRVEVSASEAHQFLLTQYLLDHAGEDRRPEAVIGIRADKVRDLSSPEMLSRNVRVEVDRDGHVVDARVIPAGVEGTDRFIENLVREVRFFPALDGGDPVEGVVTLALDTLVW
jgi:hypothetical protein